MKQGDAVAAVALEDTRQPVRRKAKRRCGWPRMRESTSKIVTFSLYREDIDRLNRMVKRLKGRGYPHASKSLIVRKAIEALDIDSLE